MKPRLYCARISARLLLRRIWSASKEGDARAVLANALDAATAELHLRVEGVPAILAENQIAGALDRAQRRIQLATKFHSTSQRFTLAHEIGHFQLHPGGVYFRDRELSAPGEHRDYVEIEADAFAAEFLMPRVFLNRVFGEIFGGAIAGTVPDPDLVAAVSAGRGAPKWNAKEFASVDPLTRASAIASAHTFRGRFFASLAEQFNVSRKAMGIQLLQMGLVK